MRIAVRRREIGLATAVLALTGMAVFAGCSSESEGHGGGRAGGSIEAVPVVVATVRREDVPVQVRAIGTVDPFSTVSVKPQVDGQLAEVHFAQGAFVRKGDLLFTIDPRPFEAALRQAEGSLAKTVAEANNAEVEFDRRERLYKDGFISRDEYDQAATRAAALRAATRAEQAMVENARLQLQYCTIRSPIDGRVGQLLVHPGNVVRRNDTTLAVINQVQPAFVTFSVPEQVLPAIRRRAAAETLAVTAEADGTPAVSGGLEFIDNSVDVTTGTVRLKGLFANRDESLWPGQFVNVALTVSTENGALVVPAAAVQTGQQGQFVFVVTPASVAEVRPVTVGMSTGADVVITEGVQAGEQIVTDGQIRLTAGSRVDPRSAEAPPRVRAESDR
ncbi:efflux RND transporter periplasmic adaptor subunit [Candidatus Binatia bacterium]|nr:efflux RND transporter periplasmic adaptor subunit [Candidatus Binatia bacterium]